MVVQMPTSYQSNRRRVFVVECGRSYILVLPEGIHEQRMVDMTVVARAARGHNDN